MPFKASAALALMVTASALAAATQLPVIEDQLVVDFIPPPDTVAEMVARSDAVIVAVHSSAEPGVFFFDGSRPGDAGIPTTIHRFHVLDVVRAHPKLPLPGEELILEMPGGERDQGTHVRRMSVRGVRPIVAGRTYVIFLRWLDRRERWDVPWGVGSAFYDVSTGGTVRSLAETPGRHDRTPITDFLSDLGVRGVSPGPR